MKILKSMKVWMYVDVHTTTKNTTTNSVNKENMSTQLYLCIPTLLLLLLSHHHLHPPAIKQKMGGIRIMWKETFTHRHCIPSHVCHGRWGPGFLPGPHQTPSRPRSHHRNPYLFFWEHHDEASAKTNKYWYLSLLKVPNYLGDHSQQSRPAPQQTCFFDLDADIRAILFLADLSSQTTCYTCVWGVTPGR